MTAQFRLSTISAVYEGGGFFRKLDGYWAFVKRINRPTWLKIGVCYTLVTEKFNGGLIFSVKWEENE